MRGLSLVVASGGHSSSRCAGLSLLRPLLLQSTGSRRAGSVIVAHGPSRFAACGIFPDQGSNPCPLHWQADSQPLRHQGSPLECIFKVSLIYVLQTDCTFFFSFTSVLYGRPSPAIYFIHSSVVAIYGECGPSSSPCLCQSGGILPHVLS